MCYTMTQNRKSAHDCIYHDVYNHIACCYYRNMKKNKHFEKFSMISVWRSTGSNEQVHSEQLVTTSQSEGIDFENLKKKKPLIET